MAAYDGGERVTMVVRVAYHPPEGSWRGFFFIEDGPPVSKKFAFVVEKLLRNAA